MIDHIFTKSLTKEDLTHGTSVRRDRINFVKYHLRLAMQKADVRALATMLCNG